MKKQPDLEFQRILKNITSHFSFLFQRDYRIVSVMFTGPLNENWNVVLSGDTWLIRIDCKEGKIHLLLSNMQFLDKIGLIDLHDLVYLLHGESNPPSHITIPLNEVEQLRKTAWLLETHFESIRKMFEGIQLGITINNARELFKNSSPALLHYQINNPMRRGRKKPRVASV